jgi:signal recognition particle receptor subunit beta
MNEVKIIFTGPVGAGKTTAVNTISDIETISNEAIATDDVNRIK